MIKFTIQKVPIEGERILYYVGKAFHPRDSLKTVIEKVIKNGYK